DLTPIELEDRLESIPVAVATIRKLAVAAICDFQLRPRNYAPFDGAELVAALYEAHVPAILCTKYETSSVAEVRAFRGRQPSLLTPDELTAEMVSSGFESCVREHRGEVSASRRGWRTLVRFEAVDERSAWIVVPGWRSQEGLRLLLTDLPGPVRTSAEAGF